MQEKLTLHFLNIYFDATNVSPGYFSECGCMDQPWCFVSEEGKYRGNTIFFKLLA